MNGIAVITSRPAAVALEYQNILRIAWTFFSLRS
jgi:hypothetical protein